MTSTNTLPAKFSKSFDGYKNNAALRGLFTFALSLINPVYAGMAIGVETALFTWQENRSKKWEILAEEFDQWESIGEELLKNQEFLHCFRRVIHATERTQNETKIRYFARLLKATTDTEIISSVEEYEEFLDIIESLSFRELTVLSVLDKYESRFPMKNGENEFQRCLHFWDIMVDELVEKFKIPREEVDSIFIRTTRSGCYKLFRGAYAAGDTEGKGTLMPIFHRLKQVIMVNNESISHKN